MRPIFLLILILFFSGNVYTQELPEYEYEYKANAEQPVVKHFPTGNELIAYRKIMRSFETKLFESLDVTEALKGISVEDWNVRSAREDYKDFDTFFDPSLRTQLLNSRELAEAHQGFLQFMYLILSYGLVLSTDQKGENLLPIELKSIVNQSPFLRIFDDGSNEENLRLISLSQLSEVNKKTDEALKLFEQLLRGKIVENPDKFTEKYKDERIGKFDKFPRINLLTKPEYGLPIGTRVIWAYGSLMRIRIALVNNKYQVVSLSFDDGD